MKPGYTIGQATQFVEDAAKQIVPPGVQGGLQGEALMFRNTVSNLAILMVLAVFVMYVILAILYESYVHPITVLSSLPVALVGGLMTLWLFGRRLPCTRIIGMFMLMGIVKKNGIMIVDFAQQRVAQGVPDHEAIHEASMERFRPIMMTTMAALLGAAPIALGFRRRRRFPAAPGSGGGGRPDRVPVHHALCDPRHVSVPGRVPGESVEPRAFLPGGPC